MTLKVDVRALPRFQKDLKRLIKKYRNVRQDLDALVELLRRGETPGDQIPRVGYAVYKVRVSRPTPNAERAADTESFTT